VIGAGRLAVDAQKTAHECAIGANPRAPRLLGMDRMGRDWKGRLGGQGKAGGARQGTAWQGRHGEAWRGRARTGGA
jgi:hypothetical protein